MMRPVLEQRTQKQVDQSRSFPPEKPELMSFRTGQAAKPAALPTLADY